MRDEHDAHGVARHHAAKAGESQRTRLGRFRFDAPVLQRVVAHQENGRASDNEGAHEAESVIGFDHNDLANHGDEDSREAPNNRDADAIVGEEAG